MLEQRDTSSLEPGPSRPGRTAPEHLFRSPYTVFTLCVLTFIASTLFLSGFYLQDIAVFFSVKVRLWHMLVVLTPTLWVSATPVIFNEWRTRRILWSGPRRQRIATGVCVVFAALMFLCPMIVPLLTPQSITSTLLEHSEDLVYLPDFPIKFLILNILGCAVSTLLTSGMFGVQLQILSQFPQSPSHLETPGADRLTGDVQRYQQLRSWLERLLGFLAASIGINILVVGALRSLLNERPPSSELLPAGSVLAFGVYYTWLLAIIYLPIRKSLNDVGQALAERLVRQSLGARVTWKESLEEQKAARTYLGLHGSALHDIQQNLSVLAPLLASISSLALGKPG